MNDIPFHHVFFSSKILQPRKLKKKTIQPCEMFPTSINDQIDISITPEDPAILTHPVN